MALKRIRLELARTPENPNGRADCGYEFVAPLDDTGHFDAEEWRAARDRCTVRRFWIHEDDEAGHLIHTRGRRWAFRYDGEGEEEDEPIFAFDRHRFVEGEYVSITEHDGVQRPFRVVRIR